MGDSIFVGELTTEPSAKGLTVRLTITNPQPHGVSVQYRSGMTADLWLVDSRGARLWAWSSEMMFTQALRNMIIAADKTFTVTFVIPQAVLNKTSQGTMMQAKYAGIALESHQPAMADIIAPLPRTLSAK
nr:BsuPI-related putative proteinase inhibitor [Shewanella sp. Isolate11]